MHAKIKATITEVEESAADFFTDDDYFDLCMNLLKIILNNVNSN